MRSDSFCRTTVLSPMQRFKLRVAGSSAHMDYLSLLADTLIKTEWSKARITFLIRRHCYQCTGVGLAARSETGTG